MILLERLTINDFRGIRRLSVDLKRKNFAVCGSNGTGKSGVVDAIEFALTGTVSRLTGKGRGDLSLRLHGPHVGSTVDDAWVEVVLWCPELGKPLTVRRSVRNPRSPRLTPDTTSSRELLSRVEDCPDVALSRRQIIRYVLTEPNQRAKDVQALLKLEALEDVRTRLQKIANAEEQVAESSGGTKRNALESLRRGMGLEAVTQEGVLDATNARRAILSLPPHRVLVDDLALDEDMSSEIETSVTSRVDRTVAKADVEAAAAVLGKRALLQSLTVEAVTVVVRLEADASLLRAVEKDDFLRTAIDLYDGDACPACGTEIEATLFAAAIAAKQTKLSEVRQLRAAAEQSLLPITAMLDAEVDALRSVFPYVKALLSESDVAAVSSYAKAAKLAAASLRALLPLSETKDALAFAASGCDVEGTIARLQVAVQGLPPPSAEHAARTFLAVAQERLQDVRRASVDHRTALGRAKRARSVLDVFNDTTLKALEKVYEDVQAAFAALYRQLNAEDEHTFGARLVPGGGKLALDVDFYGKGYYPPGAFHSEGHQDSMGLCLYLALMRHMQGSRFTIPVLDDVLMSVDAGHRREVSRMLKAEFPNTQFLLTTHDRAWLKQMVSVGLVDGKNVTHFRKWTVADGPSTWSGDSVWSEMEACVDADDVRAAAALLRHTLEHLMAEHCQALRVKVEFSLDGRHDLGDLLSPAVSRLADLLKEAEGAAKTWNDDLRLECQTALNVDPRSAPNVDPFIARMLG